MEVLDSVSFVLEMLREKKKIQIYIIKERTIQHIPPVRTPFSTVYI
jgi:hypothetical protein